MKIREAKKADAAKLKAIYDHYVLHTAVTFDYEVPTPDEFAGKIDQIRVKYPFLLAEEDSVILGYAYAGPFKGRAAYDWAVETTIYLRPDARGQGVGEMLLLSLEEELRRRHFLNAYACIAYAEKEDETLTNASMRFHQRMGYSLCGTFRKCGYKFGRWYDMIWMEKMLGEHTDSPMTPI